MADVKYKEYSEEENQIYTQSMAQIRQSLMEGMTLGQASSKLVIDDAELKGFIIDDALKVTLAEMHFGKGMAIEDLSKRLDVSVFQLHKAVLEMLDDVGHSSAEYFRQTQGGIAGNA